MRMSVRSLSWTVLMVVVVGAVSLVRTAPALSVRHVHIWVTDVERTKAFYRDELGLTVSNERPGESVEFEKGALWFGKFRGTGKPATNAITIGIAAASVQAAYDALKKNGVALPNAPSEAHGEWHFVLTDPDGYSIEIEGPK